MTIATKATSHNERGQGMLEALFAVGLVFLFFFVFVVLLWAGLVHVQADFAMHEYLVCQQTRFTTNNCRAQLTQHLSEAPQWIQYKIIHQHTNQKLTSVTYKINVLQKATYTIKKEIPLPLASSL